MDSEPTQSSSRGADGLWLPWGGCGHPPRLQHTSQPLSKEKWPRSRVRGLGLLENMHPLMESTNEPGEERAIGPSQAIN